MTHTDKALELLKKLRATINNSGITNAIYISPAQQLRDSADRMEYEEALLAEIDEFLALKNK